MRTRMIHGHIVSVSFLLVAGAVAIWLGWCFNGAYYAWLPEPMRELINAVPFKSMSSGMGLSSLVPALPVLPGFLPWAEAPYYQMRVVEVFLVASGLFSVGSIALSLRASRYRKAGLILPLIGALCLPVLFFGSAVAWRELAERGIHEESGIRALGPRLTASTGRPVLTELSEGDSFMLIELRFTRRGSGIAVHKLTDGRSVLALVAEALREIWARQAQLVMIAAGLLMATAFRLRFAWRTNRMSPARGRELAAPDAVRDIAPRGKVKGNLIAMLLIATSAVAMACSNKHTFEPMEAAVSDEIKVTDATVTGTATPSGQGKKFLLVTLKVNPIKAYLHTTNFSLLLGSGQSIEPVGARVRNGAGALIHSEGDLSQMRLMGEKEHAAFLREFGFSPAGPMTIQLVYVIDYDPATKEYELEYRDRPTGIRVKDGQAVPARVGRVHRL